MQTAIIIWTLLCAVAIIAYPTFLYRKASKHTKKSEQKIDLRLNSVKLFSFDLKCRPVGWSFTIEIPELTEDVLSNSIILFYLQTDETCLKLPVNNASLGYTSNIFKNIGKAYLTFKCIKDGVSNYNANMCNLKALKVLVIEPEELSSKNASLYENDRHILNHVLKANGVNIHQYEETLGHLSNLCKIDFMGYRKNSIVLPAENQSKTTIPKQSSYTASYMV